MQIIDWGEIVVAARYIDIIDVDQQVAVGFLSRCAYELALGHRRVDLHMQGAAGCQLR
jgi:hypothetical protein